MTLIEKLRGPSRVFYKFEADQGGLLTEAADEIERLREALNWCRDEATDLWIGNKVDDILHENNTP